MTDTMNRKIRPDEYDAFIDDVAMDMLPDLRSDGALLAEAAGSFVEDAGRDMQGWSEIGVALWLEHQAKTNYGDAATTNELLAIRKKAVAAIDEYLLGVARARAKALYPIDEACK